MNQTEKPKLPPPWSKKKRLKVAAIMSAAIFATALILGAGIYFVGANFGLFPKKAITKESLERQIIKDPFILGAVNKAASQKICRNLHQKYTLGYSPPLKPVVDSGPNACSQWQIKGSDGQDRLITVELHFNAREKIVEQYLTAIKLAYTDIFDHPEYQAMMIRGDKNNRPTAAVIFSITADETWLFELDYADDLSWQALTGLARSFRLM